MLQFTHAAGLHASAPTQLNIRNTLRTIAALTGVLALLLTPSAYAAFATPGQFEVTPSGGASYTIPIAIPPGTAGMAPSLALNYNSQGGNGLLGMGWNLSGLSAITRCPKTQVQDGVKEGISDTNADKYCLDGQRLIAIPPSVYGANGTEYRTETDGFSKIVSNGAAGTTGPANFKVWTKSGQVIEYGNTLDSAIEAQGKTAIRVWAVNKISDTKGNYLTVTYTEDNANGQYYPSRIDYTGNANATPAALLPYNSVRFVHATRPDITPLYDNGSLIKTTVRLTNIQTYAKVNNVDTLVKDYRFAYDTSAATQRSRLISLTECDGSPTGCLQPTTLGWQGSAAGWTGVGTWSGPAPGIPVSNQCVEGDFDGDGKTDMTCYTGANGLWHTALSGGNGWTGGGYWTGPVPGGAVSSMCMTGDFNGDGKTDLTCYTGANGSWNTVLSAGNGWTAVGAWSGPAPGIPVTNQCMSGDFDGDGRTDLTCYTGANGLWQTVLSGGNGWTGGGNWAGPVPGGSVSSLCMTGDFNGDGKTDLTCYTGANGLWNTVLSAGNGWTAVGAWSGPAPGIPVTNQCMSGDFNGDGKTDLTCFTGANGWHTVFSGGNGWVGGGTWSGPAPGIPVGNQCMTGDFNGDGKTDMTCYTGANGLWQTALSGGNGWTGGGTWSGPVLSGSVSSQCMTGDFDGNGKTDLTCFTNGSWNTVLGTQTLPDAVSTVTTGLGASTTITYKPLTDATVYTKEATAAYPVLDIQAPLYVVSSVASSNGIGGNYVSNYSYAGAKAHVTGGGFLGFHTTSSTDAQTGIVSTTTYRQDYPYQGLPLSAEKRTGTGTTLNSVSNTWSFVTNPAWGTQYHVPQLTQSVESSYELTGSLISTVTTCNQYDGYGNPLYIAVWSGNTSISCAAPPVKTGWYVKETTNSYTNDTVNWFLGRLKSATVTSTTP